MHNFDQKGGVHMNMKPADFSYQQSQMRSESVMKVAYNYCCFIIRLAHL